MANESNPAGSQIGEILKFLNDPAFNKGLKDVTGIMKDEGLSQADKEKLVKDLQDRDKARQLQLDGLRKKLDDNAAAIKDNEALLAKSKDAAQLIQKEINEIDARRKARVEAINKLQTQANAAHDESAKLEAELKKLREGNKPTP